MAMPLPPHRPDYSVRHTMSCAACWSLAIARVPIEDVEQARRAANIDRLLARRAG